MKNLMFPIVSLVGLFLFSVSSSASSFPTDFPGMHWNALGLAVNPDNGNIFLSSVSYGGEPNLYQVSPDGTLVDSTITAFDVGSTGNLGSATFGNNGHLFVEVCKGYTDADGNHHDERYIVEMSQDGDTIFSEFATTSYLGGTFGITYDTITNHLLFVTGRVGTEAVIRETLLDGTLLNSYSINVDNWPMDVAFDPLSQSLFSIRGYSTVLDQYVLSPQGEYILINSYELASVGILGHSFALDINRSTGLFYVHESNERVVEFSIADLDTYVTPNPVPVPDTIFLFGTGIAGLVATKVRRKKNSNQKAGASHRPFSI